MQDSNYAHDNFRQPSDIWVEKENNPKLTHEEIQVMKRKRTVDRYLLVGTHDVSESGMEVEEGVVGEEIYFMHTDQSSSLQSFGTVFYLGVLSMLNIVVCRIIIG